MVRPTHTLVIPVNAVGFGLTVNEVVLIHPVDVRVYVIVYVPATFPVTIPVVLPTGAFTLELLLQVPPEVASVSKEILPVHTVGVPLIAAGFGLTVTIVVNIQPVLNV